MSYTVALPDGRTVEFPDNVPKEKAAEILREQLGIGGSPEEGFVPAVKAGISGLKSAGAALAGRTGVMDTERAKQIMAEEEAYQQRTFKPTEKGWSGAPVTKFTELLGGSLPYIAAPLAAGAAATFGGAPALAATGLGALVSGGQFTGQFLKRQTEEGTPLEQTNLAAAAGAGSVAGALDLLSFKMFPAIRGIFGAAGKELSQDAAEQIAKQGMTKMLGDYSKATGKAIGAESTTEVAQQFLERLQAGLKLTDAQARDEYWDSLIGGAVLGGALAPAGRYIERGRIKSQQAEEARAEQTKQVQAQEAEKQRLEQEQAAYRQTPEYLDEIQTRYADLQKQEADLLARIKGKPAEGDLAAVADKAEARTQIRDLRKSDEYAGTVEEYRLAKKLIDERAKAATDKAAFDEAVKVPGAQQDLFGALPEARDTSPVGQLRTLDTQIKGLDAQLAEATKTGDQAQIQALTNQQFDLQKQFQSVAPTPEGFAAMQNTVNKQIENLRTKLSTATDTASMESLVNSIKQHKDALKQLDELKPFVAAAPKQTDVAARDVEIKDLKKKLARYQELGDDEAIGKLIPRLKELEAVPTLMEGDQFRNVPTDDLFAAEIDDGAREARETRESVEAEIEKLRAMSERVKTTSPVTQAYRDRELGKARSLLSLFEESEQDWEKLKKDPANTEFREDRDKLKETLERDIKALEKRDIPKDAVLPTRDTFELGVKRKALKNLNRRMEAADRFKDTTPLAQNIIDQRTDENVSALLDYYLPKLKPAQEGFNKQNDRAAMAREVKELRAKVHDGLIEIYDAVKIKDTDAVYTNTKSFLFNSDRLVNLNRILNNGKALEAEAKAGLREQLLTVTDDLRKTVEQLTRSKAGLRRLDKEIKEIGQPTSPEQAESLGAMEKRRNTLALDVRKLEAKTGWEDKADAVIARYSSVIPEEREVSKAGKQLPIERVEGRANRVDEIVRELRLVNEKVQKAGRPTDEAKMAALAELKDRRKDLGNELKKLRASLPSIEEANKLAGESVETAPAQAPDLFGMSSKMEKVTRAALGDVLAKLRGLYAQRTKLVAQVEKRGRLPSTEGEQKLVELFDKGPSGQLRNINAKIRELEGTRDALQKRSAREYQQYQEAARQPVVEPDQLVEMQQQLGNIERQLKGLTVESGAGNIRAQLMKARDELKAKIAAGTEEEVTAPEGKQKELPGIQPKRLAPTLREVTPEELTDARTAFVAAETKVEELKKAVRNTEALQDNPQYFSEVAKRFKDEARVFREELAQTPDNLLLQRLTSDAKSREQNARYFDMLATLSEEGRADLQAVQKELAQAQKDLPKAEAAFRDLERRQRMQQQQQAAVTGATPGQVEAERIQAGESREFRAPSGKVLTKPKKAESWDIKKQSVAPVAKVPEVVKAQKALSRATEVARMSGRELTSARGKLAESGVTQEIRQQQKVIQELEPLVKGAFSEENVKAIDDELAKIDARLAQSELILQARGSDKPQLTSPVIAKMKGPLPKDYAASIDFAEKEARSEYMAAKKLSDAAQTAYEGARKAIDNLPATASGLEFGRLDSAMARASSATDKLLPKTQAAELLYLVARRDNLTLSKLMGQDLREAFVDTSARLAKALNQESPLLKQIEEAKAAAAKAEKARAEAETKAREEERKIQAEKNAGAVEKQKALDAAKAEKERLEKAKSGAGYDTRRFTRDTSNPLMTAELNRLKRELATADTNLGKAREKNNVEDIKKYQAEYDKIESNIDTLYSVAPIVERDLEQGTGLQPDVAEGMRLPARKEGPVVRNMMGAKRVRQSGVTKLRADGLSQEAANAVHLFTVKARLDGATEASRAKLETAYAEATEGLTEEQIAAQLAEGERLLGQGPTIEIIAARERFRQSVIELEKAQKDFDEAKTPATKELAQDALDLANQRSDAAEEAYKNARDVRASKALKGGAQAEVEAAIDAATAKQEAATLPEFDEEGPIQGAATQYTEMDQVQLSDAAKEAIADGRLLDAVNDVAKNGQTDFIRQNAKNVVDMLLRTKVVIDPDLTDAYGNPVPAFYNNVTNTVSFRPGELTEENLIHEVTHAASLRGLVMPASDLTKEQLNARNELTAMYNQLKKDKALVNEYGLTNVAEFASEVQSNKDFRDQINKKPWFGGNMLSRFFQALLRLVGFKTGQVTSDVATKNIEALYMPAQKFQMVDQINAPSVFRTKAPASTSVIVGQEAGKTKTLKENFFGLGGRVQLVDKLAAADAAIVAGEGAGKLSSTEAFQAQYFMRLADNTTQTAGQFITHGPVSIVADKTALGTEYRYQSSGGANLVQMTEHLDDAAKAGLGADAERLLTVQIAGERAEATPNGWARLLSSDPEAAKAEYLRDKATLAANPAAKKSIDAAKAVYKQYNNGLIDFIVQCGFISKQEGERLKKTPFVPFYRVENNEVKLFTDKESSIRIGNIKENPDLQRMLGDEKTILPILTSAVQNTFMLSRAGLRNNATHKTADALYKAGFASKIGKGSGPSGTDVVRYKVDGVDYFAVIDTDTFGIPAHLIVKGMEGIKTTIPAIVQMMGIPADWVRKFVTRSPAYAIRQLIRDPVNAAIVGGVDGVPVVNALKQLAKMRAGRSPAEEALMRGLAISSNIYTGDEKDMQKFLQDIGTGRGKWDKMLGMLDTVALQSDAATRATIYEDSLKKGFTEAQAQFRAFESQNFSRRGLSPSMQMLSTMVPFFNAQIQGLDVLYRSFKGTTPFAERLEIQRKIKARGLMLMAGTMAYALMMEDNEDYRKLPPEVKYGNWFVYIPNVKEPLKIPIPYEVGILFKALPEAILDVARRDTKAKEAIKGLGMLLWQSTPGVVPVAGKPLIEASIGATAYGPIESAREKDLPAAMRYREETTEVAKALGSFTGAVGVSPLLIEHFVRSYTSNLGLSALHMLDPVLRSSTEGEKASSSASKLPFIGGLFQSTEGRFIIDRAYERMEEVVRAQKGYEDLERRGKKAEARAWAQEYASLLAQSDMAGGFKKSMGEMFTDERTVRANSRLSTEQKDKLIARIKAAQNREAEAFYQATERRRPQ
jgi:hypothetical protein